VRRSARRHPLFLLGCCLTGSVLVFAALAAAPAVRADEQVVRSAHYELHYEGTHAAAEEAARILEAAWSGFRAFFDAEPPLKPAERLRVRFYMSRAAWVAGLRADGVRPPDGAGGYYWPGTKTAYLYRQPTQYFTRTLLVHEAGHQFHFLARTHNKAPSAPWYTEGIVEFLSWHRWDGERLDLGVLPGVSLQDYPAVALRALEAKGFDLGAFVDGRLPAARPIAWALLRYLATGRAGKPLPGFESFRQKMDRGAQAPSTFKHTLGRPGKLLPRLRAWLRANQAAWAQVFNEWEQTGPAAFRGHAGVVSACRLKRSATSLQAVFTVAPVQPRWRAGLLLHWSDVDDYTVALVTRAGEVAVDRHRRGRWERLFSVQRPAPDHTHSRRLRAVREGPRVAFFLDGRRVGAWALPGKTLGLAMDNGDVAFSEVSVR